MVPRRGKNAYINKYENENEEYKKRLENNCFDPIPIYSIGKDDPPMYSFPRDERFKSDKYT
jgi:hypothetical protein